MTLRLSGFTPASLLAVGGILLAGCATGELRASRPLSVIPVLEAAPATVVFVNEELRFVVLDFGTQPPPAIGTRLTLYRGGQRIGSVVVTEPVRGRFAAADIVAGTAQRGDTVAAPGGSAD